MSFEYNDRNQTWTENEHGEGNIVQKWLQPKYRKTLITIVVLAIVIVASLVIYFHVGATEVAEEREDLKTLKLVSILFRHGARTPTGSYATDPYKNYNWPDGWGELTNLGKQQLYNLGRTFRKRYAGFLPDDYSGSDMYMKSSDRSRTIMSGSSLLAGLYPPTAKQTWNPDIKWQPIPVHSLIRQYDNLLAANQSCPYYLSHFEEIKQSDEIKKKHAELAELYANLTLHCGQPYNTFLAIEHLYSHLEIQQANGLTLPEWTKGIFPEQFKDIPGYSLAFYTYDEISKRFKGGPLLAEILHQMEKKAAGTLKPDRKLFLYSGHDLTIVSLWRTLTFEEIILPDFGASIVIELHDFPGSNDTEVKLLYYNSSSTVEPYRLSMPFCSPPCMMSEFKKLTEKHIPIDWESECIDGPPNATDIS